MIPHDELNDMRRRLARSAPGPWVVERDDLSDTERIRTAVEERANQLVIWRDFLPAADADVEFIALARNLLPRLVQAAAGDDADAVTDEELAAAENAGRKASGGPWVAFVEDDLPEGVGPYIRVGGDAESPDMYVWLGDEFAPSGDVELIAQVRQDVPRLVRELRQRQH